MEGRKVKKKEKLITREHNIMTAAVKTQAKHLLFVCDEKVKVSLAKSSLFSNFSSLALVQKLFSERSSAPIWRRCSMYSERQWSTDKEK